MTRTEAEGRALVIWSAAKRAAEALAQVSRLSQHDVSVGILDEPVFRALAAESGARLSVSVYPEKSPPEAIEGLSVYHEGVRITAQSRDRLATPEEVERELERKAKWAALQAKWAAEKAARAEYERAEVSP